MNGIKSDSSKCAQCIHNFAYLDYFIDIGGFSDNSVSDDEMFSEEKDVPMGVFSLGHGEQSCGSALFTVLEDTYSNKTCVSDGNNSWGN